jgi:hypothetical protein
VQSLPAEKVSGFALGLVALAGLATVVAHPILFAIARRRQAREAAAIAARLGRW